MSKPGLFAFAAQFAPRLFHVRRRTWVAVGVGLLVLFGLLIWAAVALIGWFFGQTQGWIGAAPEAARGALEQMDRAVPGAREKLGEFVPVLKPGGHERAASPPQRDVSGSDLGPVARYPGMARTYWHREGDQVTIEYEGKADYAAVLDHYARGFAAQGYAQSVQSATPSAETHEYTKDRERIALTITQQPKGGVGARIETPLQ
ncbi:MAG: hypothetical protein ABS92_01205 [Thiobacillus sp. SCN 63-374]|nr:MAG: hypothetical protein ABS92_01205 [Thiobacillus sp. SCN 63-374]